MHLISCESIFATASIDKGRLSHIISRAGSETTATTLSAIHYYLVRNPDVCKRLQDEIRTTFKSYDEINATSTASLEYLGAVCREALRIFPPVPIGLPRLIPEGGDTVDGKWIPGGVGSETFAVRHCFFTDFSDQQDNRIRQPYSCQFLT